MPSHPLGSPLSFSFLPHLGQTTSTTSPTASLRARPAANRFYARPHAVATRLRRTARRWSSSSPRVERAGGDEACQHSPRVHWPQAVHQTEPVALPGGIESADSLPTRWSEGDLRGGRRRARRGGEIVGPIPKFRAPGGGARPWVWSVKGSQAALNRPTGGHAPRPARLASPPRPHHQKTTHRHPHEHLDQPAQRLVNPTRRLVMGDDPRPGPGPASSSSTLPTATQPPPMSSNPARHTFGRPAIHSNGSSSSLNSPSLSPTLSQGTSASRNGQPAYLRSPSPTPSITSVDSSRASSGGSPTISFPSQFGVRTRVALKVGGAPAGAVPVAVRVVAVVVAVSSAETHRDTCQHHTL